MGELSHVVHVEDVIESHMDQALPFGSEKAKVLWHPCRENRTCWMLIVDHLRLDMKNSIMEGQHTPIQEFSIGRRQYRLSQLMGIMPAIDGYPVLNPLLRLG